MPPIWVKPAFAINVNINQQILEKIFFIVDLLLWQGDVFPADIFPGRDASSAR